MTNIREINSQLEAQNRQYPRSSFGTHPPSVSVWGEYDNFRQGFGRSVGDSFQDKTVSSEIPPEPVKIKSDIESARDTAWELMKKYDRNLNATISQLTNLYPKVDQQKLKNIMISIYIAMDGDECFNDKKYSRAIFCYTEALKHDPEAEKIYFLRAATKCADRDYKGAIEDYTKILELNPENKDALSKLTETQKKFADSITQIKNDYYTGDSYTVNRNGNVISIINQRTNEDIVLNLEDLCQNLSDEMKEKVYQEFEALPAEVMFDIAKEVAFKQDEKIAKDSTAAFYQPFDDTITLDVNKYYNRVLPHETGHSLDYNSGGKAATSEDRNFMESFESELKDYIAAGNVQYKESENGEASSGNEVNIGNYATMNEREMFAECYTLMMMGDCNSKDCIVKYFPKTLEAAKNLLKRIRSLSDKKRHADISSNEKFRLIKRELWNVMDNNGYNNFTEGAKEILNLYPQSVQTKIRDMAMSVVYAYFANMDMDIKQYRSAIEYYDKAIDADPEDGDLYISRGDAKYALEDYAGAVEDYKKAIELKPKDRYINSKLEEAQKAASKKSQA